MWCLWRLSDLVRQASKKHLDVVRWQAAFQAYALAADACGIWMFADALAHLRVCMEIAATTRNHALAMGYDAVCRKEWSTRASRGLCSVLLQLPSWLRWRYFACAQAISTLTLPLLRAARTKICWIAHPSFARVHRKA